MHVRTAHYGLVEVAPEDMLRFERGLFGFEDVSRWVLLAHAPGSPLRILQAIDRPDLALVVIEPFLVCPDYSIDLPPADAAAVHWWEDAGILVLATVGIPDDSSEMTVNLKGPIVVNPARRIGVQVVQAGDRWAARHRIEPPAAQAER
jgi:flagellar assembly factor FliW